MWTPSYQPADKCTMTIRYGYVKFRRLQSKF